MLAQVFLLALAGTSLAAPVAEPAPAVAIAPGRQDGTGNLPHHWPRFLREGPPPPYKDIHGRHLPVQGPPPRKNLQGRFLREGPPPPYKDLHGREEEQ